LRRGLFAFSGLVADLLNARSTKPSDLGNRSVPKPIAVSFPDCIVAALDCLLGIVDMRVCNHRDAAQSVLGWHLVRDHCPNVPKVNDAQFNTLVAFTNLGVFNKECELGGNFDGSGLVIGFESDKKILNLLVCEDDFLFVKVAWLLVGCFVKQNDDFAAIYFWVIAHLVSPSGWCIDNYTHIRTEHKTQTKLCGKTANGFFAF